METKLYEIINDQIDFGFGEELNNIIIKMYYKVHHFPLWQISKLKKLIKKYPEVPQLKNYLMVAYQKKRMTDKANEIIFLINEKHPDYFFGKVSLANLYIENGEYQKVPEVLGSIFSISEIYPERDIFHISEVANFNVVVAKYYLEKEGTNSKNFRVFYNNINLACEKATGDATNKYTEILDEIVIFKKEEEDKQKINDNITFVSQEDDKLIVYDENLNIIEKSDYTPQKKIPYTKKNKELGRNEPCHCGSNKKYKKCCMKKDKETEN